jgi:transcriptional regulator with XRE-family HTH domain
MSIVSDNIRFLRKRAGYTQESFANEIGIKRSLVGAYEESRADPRLNNLLNIAQLFGYSVDTLLSKPLQGLNESELEQLKSANAKPAMKVLSITVDKEERENIELVPQKAAAGYTNGFSDPEYIKELPKFRLPFLPSNATYRAFEITGDSMLPLQSGTIVIGSYIEKIDDIVNGRTYVVVSAKEGVVYKRVFNYANDRGKLFLVSDNQSFSPFEIDAGDVLELWEAKAFISVQFPTHAPGASSASMDVNQLAEMVMELRQEVVKLKNL